MFFLFSCFSLPFLFNYLFSIHLIGHFRVATCLCVRTSLSGKQFIWLPSTGSFLCKSNSVSHEDLFWNWGTKKRSSMSWLTGAFDILYCPFSQSNEWWLTIKREGGSDGMSHNRPIWGIRLPWCSFDTQWGFCYWWQPEKHEKAWLQVCARAGLPRIRKAKVKDGASVQITGVRLVEALLLSM